MTKIIFLSVLIMLVSAPSRILPIFFLADKKLPTFANSFLYYVPYAVLGALIFPDVLTSAGSMLSSCVGTTAALILAWSGQNIIIVLVGGILAAYLSQLI